MNGEFDYELEEDFRFINESSVAEESFFSTALNHVNSFIAPIQDFQKTPAGSQIFEAIYQFGRGKVEVARERAVAAFLSTGEGQKIQAEGVKQTLESHAPIIILAVLAVVFLFVMTLGRR